MPGDTGCALFLSPIGTCALAWRGDRLIGLRLPERSPKVTLSRLRHAAGMAPEARPPAWVRRVVRRLQLHLSGQPQDLTDVPLELSGLSPFHRLVYRTARHIQPGFTLSYQELAETVGRPGAARAVGMAMARNPFPLVVPCHRVVATGGRPGGFSAGGGLTTKRRLLLIEGVSLPGRRRNLFAGRYRLPFDPGRATSVVRRADPRFSKLVERVGPFALRLESCHGPFEALAEAIIYQQLNGKAAAAIASRFQKKLGGGSTPPPQAVLRASTRQLSAVGLSGPKIRALKDLAARTLDGTVPPLRRLRRMGDEEIVEQLTRVRGVGRWTAQMLLIFRLGRPDVLPADDYGIRQALTRLLQRRQLITPAQVSRYGERFRPYRTVASWYLWRLLELPVALDDVDSPSPSGEGVSCVLSSGGSAVESPPCGCRRRRPRTW